MKHTTNRLLSILFYSDLHGVRILLAVSEFIWAVTLFWPGETFGRPTYIVMASLMPEDAWAITFLVSSILQYYIVHKGEFHSKFATYFAAWNSVLWLYVVISMYLSVTPPPAAISGEMGLAFGAAWVWIRSGYNISRRRITDYASDQHNYYLGNPM